MGFSSILQRLETRPRTLNGRPSTYLCNEDLRPLPQADRTWGKLAWFSFWLSAASGVANWNGISAGLTLGLSSWDMLGAIIGGRIILEFLIVANGRSGAIYHIPFPSIIRASWGIYGGYWPVVNRIVMTIVFLGLTTAQGGFCVYVMLHAIFPSITKLPNIMRPSDGINSGELIGICIFWVVVIFFNMVPVPKLKWTIYIKAVVFFICAFAMLGWTSKLAGGFGKVFSQPSRVSGSERTWLIVRFLFLQISNSTDFIMNAADWQRYTKKPIDTIIGQLIGGPIAHFLINLIGGLVASAGMAAFGTSQWNPVLLLDEIQSSNYTAANRAGCFFLGLGFTYCTLITIVLENGLPAGNDLAGMFPKYINYKRGTIICGILGLVICPWRLLASAATFIAYLSDYGIFLSSFIGIMLVHYYVLTRGHYEIGDLFADDKTGSYYYFHGINLRAVAAYVLGMAPCLYGFAGAVGVPVPLSVIHSFYFSVPIGIATSSLCYLLICLYWPVPHQVPITAKKWVEPEDYIRRDEILVAADNSSLQDREMNNIREKV